MIPLDEQHLDPWCSEKCPKFKAQPLYYGKDIGIKNNCVNQDICRNCLEQYNKWIINSVGIGG